MIYRKSCDGSDNERIYDLVGLLYEFIFLSLFLYS